MPELLSILFKFSTYFAQASNHSKFLHENKFPIQWIGSQHVFLLLEFIKTFYTSSLFGKMHKLPFDYLGLTP
jgi:hypothetical protein